MKKNVVLLLLVIFVVCVSIFIVRTTHAPTHVSDAGISDKNISLVILPHHNLLMEYYPSFYSQLTEEPENIQHVIILSPNHFHGDFQSIVTYDEHFWREHENNILVDENVVDSFLQQKLVLVENQFFTNEHGVRIHLPFIKEYFPQSKVSAFLFTRNISKEVLDLFANTVVQALGKEKAVVLVSSDFSHYLPLEEAEVNDQKSVELLREKKNDEIYQLSDDYVDCSACVYVLTKLSSALRYESLKEIFHSNSAHVQDTLDIPETTSYFVLKWQ